MPPSVTADWTTTDHERYGLQSWGKRVRDEKLPADNPYLPPHDMLQLNKSGLYEAMDRMHHWWPIELTDINEDGSYQAAVHDDAGGKQWPVVHKMHVRRVVVEDPNTPEQDKRRRCDKCNGTGKTSRMMVMTQQCPQCNGTGREHRRSQLRAGDGAEVLRSTGAWVPCIIREVRTDCYIIDYDVDRSPCTKNVPFIHADETLRPCVPRSCQFDGHRRLTDYEIQPDQRLADAAASAEGAAVFRAAPKWGQHPVGHAIAIWILPTTESPAGAEAARRLSAARRFTDGELLPQCPYVMQMYTEFDDYPEYAPQQIFDSLDVDRPSIGTGPPVTRCYITQLVHPGSDLESICAARRKRGVSLTSREGARLAQQLAAAVAHCHARGVVHRQLSARCVFVSEPPPQQQPARGVPVGQPYPAAQGVASAPPPPPDDALCGDFTARICGFADAVECPRAEPPRRGDRRGTGEKPVPLLLPCRAHPLPADRRPLPPEVLTAYAQQQAQGSDACADWGAADVFGVGVVLHAALRGADGQDPWGRPDGAGDDSPSSADPALVDDDAYVDLPESYSAELRALVRSLLRRDPNARPLPAEMVSAATRVATALRPDNTGVI